MRPRRFRSLVSAFAISAGLGLAVGLAAVAPDAAAQDGKTVLRFVPHAGLRITDPIMTTAYISRNHGYMIYDTLFSVNDKFEPKPQMVEKYEISQIGRASCRERVCQYV